MSQVVHITECAKMDIRLSLKSYKQCEKNNNNTDIPKVTDIKKVEIKQQSPRQ